MTIGVWQVVLVLLIVLILFGAGKLPKVMGDVASGVKNFKAGMKEDPEDNKKSIPSDNDEVVASASKSEVKDEGVKS